MLVRSTILIGHRRGGGVLLRKGNNDIDEDSLTRGERSLIAALAHMKIVEVIEDPPPSGTQLIPLADEPPRPLKKRVPLSASIETRPIKRRVPKKKSG